MAKTFEQWMADNQMTTGSGPNFVYGRPAYNQAQGSAGDRSTAILNWQREQGADYLSQLLGGGSASATSSSGGVGNPFGVPTMNTGNRFESGLSDAESRLKSLLDNPDSINQSAAYKFRVKQGEDALQRQMGARGMLNSGNRLMELTKYGQDMGSQEYENQFGRLNNLLTNYSGSWIGDKNANTSRYAAQANAWNTAQGNADANRYRMGNLAWEMQKPQVGGTTRSISQMLSPRTGMTSYGMDFGGGVY